MTETILMLHGMWCGGWCWENFRRYFEEKGYRCITPTLRFHDMDPGGAPDRRLGTTSLLDYADDLERDVRKLDSIPIIMGHSMGALLAQMLGSRGLVKALILLTPAAPRGILALTPSVIRSFWSGLTRWGFWGKPMRQTFNEAVYSTMHLMSAEEQQRLFRKYVYESGRAACEIGFWLLDLKGAAKVDESRITCPVLIVGATQDRITPVSVAGKVAAKYKGVATYKEFEDHAHWVLLEPGWQEVAEYVYSWINSLASADES
ncbi:alpha/beta hydrolase [Chloroflexota bacterium]